MDPVWRRCFSVTYCRVFPCRALPAGRLDTPKRAHILARTLRTPVSRRHPVSALARLFEAERFDRVELGALPGGIEAKDDTDDGGEADRHGNGVSRHAGRPCEELGEAL